ncbi:beta-lactamase regulating signal transducer with metallopeptidase domain [Baia soyae]|uniref:Beta-lactamase regulating signal transducer with metallopeptidase domain n=2 Tax=Baia soyae TaxID=1544746 RepID=A0A4R2RTV8_9BACL|nr:beta-lactamase regulating signal transducer with metallopeptidase domain [Baia soyae]
MNTMYIYLQYFFSWVLDASIMASVLVVLVLLMKGLLRDKLTIRWQYLLWTIVMVRLLLPWAPESSYSIYNFLPSIQDVSSLFDRAVPSEEIATTDVSLSEKEKLISEKNAMFPVVGEQQQDPYSISHYIPSVPSDIPLLSIWLSGVVCLSALLFLIHKRINSNLKKQPLITDERAVQVFEQCKRDMSMMNQHIPLVHSNKIPGPAVFGFYRPRIILSDAHIRDLDDDELRYIFYHELSHIKRRDVGVNSLMNVFLILHWFNPILWCAYYRMREDQEIACDALALTFVGSEQKESYGHTIIRLLENEIKPHSLSLSISARLVGKKSHIKRRIIMIKKFNKKAYRLSILGIAAVAALSVGVFTNISSNDAQAKEGKQSTQSEKKQELKLETTVLGSIYNTFDTIEFPTKISGVDPKTMDGKWELDLLEVGNSHPIDGSGAFEVDRTKKGDPINYFNAGFDATQVLKQGTSYNYVVTFKGKVDGKQVSLKSTGKFKYVKFPTKLSADKIVKSVYGHEMNFGPNFKIGE